MGTIGSLVVKISTDIKDFTGGLDRVANSTKSFDKFVRTSFDVGAKAITAMGAAASAVGVNATRMAVDFESSFAGVKKTLDATDEEFAQLSTGLRNLAQEVPVNVNELNRIAESAGALGIAKEGVLGFTKVISQMATTTNLTADAAANDFARISTIMGVSAEDFSRLGSTIVDLGNKGSTTESEITAMSLRIMGAAKTVGMSTAEVAGFAASLSNVGIEAEMGGTAISKIMIDMASNVASGGDKLEVFGRVAGMTAEQFATAFKTNAASAIGAFIAGLGKIQSSGGNLFATLEELDVKEVRLRDTMLRTASAGDMVSKTLDIARTAWAENSALSAEAGKRYETTASQLQVFHNKLADTQITLGTALLPVLLKVLEASQPLLAMVKNMADGFAALDPQAQLVIAGLTAFSAVFYPAVIALGSFTTAIKALIPVVTSLWGLIAAHPFVAIGTAVAALAVAVVMNWDKITKVIEGWATTVAETVDVALQAIGRAFATSKDFVLGTVKQLVDGVKGYFAGLFAATFNPLRNQLEAMKGWFRGVTDDVVTHSSVPDLVNGVQKHIGRLDAVMVKPTQLATSQVSTLFRKTEDAVKNVTGTVSSLQEFGTALVELNGPAIIGSFQGLIGGLSSTVAAIGGMASAMTALLPLWNSTMAVISAHPFAAIGLAAAALAVAIYTNWDKIKQYSQQLYSLLNDVLGKRIADIFASIKAPIQQATQWFKEMYDKVVGHSYIPDMVEEIGDHMRNLDVTMTAPARNAVVNTARVIEGGALTWSSTINQFASTANQTWGTVSSTFASNLAAMTDGAVAWGEVIKQMGLQVMTNLITVFMGIATQWAVSLFAQTAATTSANAAQVASHTAMESAKTAATAAGESSRMAIVLATNKVIMAGVISTLAGIGAVGNAALATMQIVVTTVSSIMAGIGAALVAGVFTAPIGASMLAAAGGLLATGTASVVAGVGALQGAMGAAITLATAALATPFAAGGIVKGPTVGLMGEAGSPEAAIPLNNRGAAFMQKAMGLGGNGGPVTIYLQVDSRTMAKAVVPQLHNVIHTKLGYT